MPLMMNEDIVNLDDLFDDGTVLAMTSRPPPKELFQRIDELRGSGSHQEIAWSRSGCLASISESGLDLEFRNLRCHPRDGSWDLSEPTIPDITQIKPSTDAVPFQHLCWSPNGSDLAAIDVAGRISLMAVNTFLNKPSPIRSGSIDTPDELRAVVGAYWLNLLPVQSRPIMTSLAVKGDKGYQFEMAQGTCFGPCHPNPTKSALLCLTTNGDLRLIWQQSDGKWNETSREMESFLSSTELITHASFCADKNQTLLVAYATTTKHLRAVRVLIKWGNKPNEKPANNTTSITVNPDLIIAHLAATNWMDGTPIDGPDHLNIQSSMTALSHLEIIPPTNEGPSGLASQPTILTVRSSLPASPTQYNHDVCSTIDRWELRDSAQSVHPAFQQLGSRKNTASQLTNAITFKKLDGFTLNKVVIFVQAVCLDRILCFGYSDGLFEYRDRNSLAQTFTEGGIERFTHISQAGFSFEDEEPCLQIALSPTTCSFVQIGCDGKYKWKSLKHHLEEPDMSIDNVQYGALVAGLTMACSAAVVSSVNYDDVLGIAHRYTTQPTVSYDLISDVSRVLKLNVDYSDESHHDTLIRNPSVQLCLSIQNSLGYIGDGQPRKFGSKIAWVSLQIRNCVVLMTMAASMKVPDPDHPQKKISGLEDAEAIRILSGSVRWCLDLMAWLVDSLLNPDDPSIFKGLATGQPIDLENFTSRLQATNNVALHLLLASATRGYLTAICRRLNNLDFTARKAMSTVAQSQAVGSYQYPPPLTSGALRAGYTTIATLTSKAVVKMRNFEIFLNGISTSVKDAYTTAGLPPSVPQQAQQQQQSRTEPTRNAPEQSMLFGGSLPAPLVPAMRQIFSSLLPDLRSSIDHAELFFHDFSLLALDPFPPSSVSAKQTRADTPPDEDSTLSALLSDRNGKTPERRNNNYAIAHVIDIFQRVPVELGREPVVPATPNPGSAATAATIAPGRSEGRRWRRCARCTAVMEDFLSPKPAVQFLILQQRRCFCSGSWDIISGRQVVA